ncbi:MAG: hypothetical protein DMF17_13250 [Verrucomicrobia bacterium]|nr:MAG: hypothetical protein DMF17_13250 [Verrucomicrobiota bacterium]
MEPSLSYHSAIELRNADQRHLPKNLVRAGSHYLRREYVRREPRRTLNFVRKDQPANHANARECLERNFYSRQFACFAGFISVLPGASPP